MKADEAFAEIIGDGHRFVMGDCASRLYVDFHKTGYITVWWKGEPIEFVPLFGTRSVAEAPVERGVNSKDSP